MLYRLLADIPDLNAQVGSLLVLSSGSVQLVTTLALDAVVPFLNDPDVMTPVSAADVSAPTPRAPARPLAAPRVSLKLG